MKLKILVKTKNILCIAEVVTDLHKHVCLCLNLGYNQTIYTAEFLHGLFKIMKRILIPIDFTEVSDFGIDIAKKISEVAVNENDQPLEPVYLKSVEILDK